MNHNRKYYPIIAIAVAMCLVLLVAVSTPAEKKFFDDMDAASKFHRNCVARGGTITTDVLGYGWELTCLGGNQDDN